MISHFPNKRRRLSRILLLACLKDIVSYFMIRWQILFWYVILRRDVCIHIFSIYTKIGITRAKLFNLMQIWKNIQMPRRPMLMGSRVAGCRALWMLNLGSPEEANPCLQAWKLVLVKEPWATSRERLKPSPISKWLLVFSTRTSRCSWSLQRMTISKLPLRRWEELSRKSYPAAWMTRDTNIKSLSLACTTKLWCCICLPKQERSSSMS